MQSTQLAGLGLAAALVSLLPAMPAQAQLFRTYLSASGSDGNDCSFAHPCATMDNVITKTLPGGIVTCLDASNFQQIATIGISLTIDCGATTGTAGTFIIDGAQITVVIKNLRNTPLSAVSNITFTRGAALFVDNVHFSNSAHAIFVNTTTPSNVVVTNSTFRNTSGAAVLIQPGPCGSVWASFDNVTIANNTGAGLRADGTGGGPVTVDISNSAINFNGVNGVIALSGASGNVAVNVTGTTIASNISAGIQSNQSSGGNATVTVNNSSILNNGTALNFFGGGSLLTYGNNRVVGPPGTGFSGPVGLQ